MHCSLPLCHSMSYFFFYFNLSLLHHIVDFFSLGIFRSMQLHIFELTYQFFCVVFISRYRWRLNTVNDLFLLVCIYSIVLAVTINFIRSILFRFWFRCFWLHIFLCVFFSWVFQIGSLFFFSCIVGLIPSINSPMMHLQTATMTATT